jgi:hypothetical protein
MKEASMYDVTLQSPDRYEFADPGEALQRALFSAMQGRAATVHREGELVWEIEVDTKVSPSDLFHPAIVHFRLWDLDSCPPWRYRYFDLAKLAPRVSKGSDKT